MTIAEATPYADEVHDAAEQGRKPSAFVPNLITEMTKENPTVADAYLTSQGFHEEGGALPGRAAGRARRRNGRDDQRGRPPERRPPAPAGAGHPPHPREGRLAL